MHTHHRPIHPPGTAASSRLAAGFLLSLTLLSTACSDAMSPVATASLDPAALPTPSLFADKGGQPTFADPGFAVLAYTAVTCTDGTITGDVGTYLASPFGSFTQTNCSLVGTVHLGDSEAQAAYDAFVDQYDALAPALGECTTDNTLTGTLADVRLKAGTYCISAEAKTGVLTLIGSGSWTFKVLGALTGTNFTVVMAGGAVACDVTWWVDAAATLTDSNFLGNILAGAAITMTRGTFYGNAWSQADVTITGTAATGCASSNGDGKDKCNQGVGNGPEGCDPGNSNHNQPSNDENGGTPGKPGRKG